MMKKIKFMLLAAMAVCLTAPVFTSCSSDNTNDPENLISEYSYNDNLVAAQKAKSKKKAINQPSHY